MSLDDLPCPNFRDVGDWITLIAGPDFLPPNRLFRGGKLNAVRVCADIGSPRLIVNLRMGCDHDALRTGFGHREVGCGGETFGAPYRHVAIPNEYEKYETKNRTVRRWLNAVAEAITDAGEVPILVHCTSGKDRTGVVVAMLLLLLDVPKDAIAEEYLLSSGEVQRTWIEAAMAGIGDVRQYLDRVDVSRIRALLRG